MDKTQNSLELTFDRVGNEVRISARSSRLENLPVRSLGVDVPTLLKFAAIVQRAAAHGRPLDDAQIVEAQSIQKALVDEGIDVLLAQMREASGDAVLVRLFASDAQLQTVPWEAVCYPGEALGFWGTSPQVFPVRGVTSKSPWAPREIRGAVKVLAIAPTGSAGLTNLKQALDERIQSGEIEWLEPIEGPAAKVQNVLDRLRREPIPNVIHFLGHGTIDGAGRPSLRMGDHDDEETWLPAEVLAQQLVSSFRGMLRLIVLEACEGAKPSAFSSAAEILARAGADAVVAFAWPVRADVARTCSVEFYRAITGSEHRAGDVAFGMNEARRAILAAHEMSAESLGPVLFLRGPDGKVFDFKGRKVNAPKKSITAMAGLGEVPKSLVRVVQGKFSLVLGEDWKDENESFDEFRNKLHKELAKATTVGTDLPLSTLAQWFALRKSSDKLDKEFQKAFPAQMGVPPVVAAIAKRIRPGVHTTLLRNAWLEQSLAEARPGNTIYVIQPDDTGATVMKREAGEEEWNELDEPPSDVDLDEEFLILRPYRGYTPEMVFTRPLLTEDDYYLRLRELWNPKVIPVDLAHAMRSSLGYKPALILGLSVLTAHHRMLLQNLYSRGLPRDSLAVVEKENKEAAMWESGAGLPGRDEGIEVLEMSAADLRAAFERMTDEAAP
jgi:hypothetical protein